MAGESLSLITRRFINTPVPIVYFPAPVPEAPLGFRVGLPSILISAQNAFACEAFALCLLAALLADLTDMPAHMYGVGLSRWARGVLSKAPGMVRRLTGWPLTSLLLLQSHQH